MERNLNGIFITIYSFCYEIYFSNRNLSWMFFTKFVSFRCFSLKKLEKQLKNRISFGIIHFSENEGREIVDGN